jgi:hypothetical protein
MVVETTVKPTKTTDAENGCRPKNDYDKEMLILSHNPLHRDLSTMRGSPEGSYHFNSV